MSAGDARAEARALARRYLDGVTGAEEVAALDRLVRTDGTAARALLEAARFEADLEAALRGPEAAARAPDPGAPARRRWIARGAPVAAAGLVAAVAWLSLRGRSTDGPQAPAPATPTALAPPSAAPAPPRRAPAVAPAPAWIETPESLFALEPALGRGARLARGSRERCPPGIEARRCFRADRNPRTFPGALAVVVASDEGLFAWDDDLLLVFDYWLGESSGPNTVRLTGWLQTTDGAGFEIHVAEPPARGRWARAVYPLRSYVRQFGGPAPAPGTRVRAFNVGCGYWREDVFLVANLRVVRGRQSAPAAP